MKNKKLSFAANITSVFEAMDITYDELKSLMLDLRKGEFAEGMTKQKAEEKLREITLKFFGLEKGATKRERTRACREYARSYFDVIEEVADISVTTGLKELEWFNALVNYVNISEGQENLFYQDHEEVILSVARMGKRHHDTILQRLPQGGTYTVDTDVYGAAIGAHIDRYITGAEDWNKLMDAIDKAFIAMVQDLILTEVMTAYEKLPVQEGFVDSGAVSPANKKKIDKMLQNVSVANDNADVVIIGDYTALQQFENLVPINWIASSQKESVAEFGRLGNYGKYQFVEIPQRFLRNKPGQFAYRSDILMFLAVGDTKLVDFVDVGETIIDEITERGEANGRMDDMMKYEVQREFGAASRFGRYFGQWTITED